MILPPGYKFFPAKCVQFPLTFTEWKKTVIIHFWEKTHQEINFKSHVNSALLCKQGKILSDLHMSSSIYFTLLIFAHFCHKTERCQL